MSEPPPRAPLRVLVVDDSPDAAESLCVLLGLWGYQTASAPDGRSALEAAALFRPDVVFLDVQMPGMHGGDVARRLRRLPGLAGTRIVALSATDPQDLRLAGYAGAFDGYLLKPCAAEDLQQLLARPPTG